ncbi:MAG: hypothetical protein GY753_17940 [Gammaproteobacteria bacterium]|nr:hypothetical protein [Gammaproteobacteria bacterium]
MKNGISRLQYSSIELVLMHIRPPIMAGLEARAGCNTFLNKPVDNEILLQTVREWIE